MAILKHKGYKSADYTSCQQYYLFEHDEITHKPILDPNGNLIPRQHVLTAAQNTTWDDWARDCWEVNNKFNQNQERGDVKTHEYVLSFDPRDGLDNGLTLEKSLEIGKEFAAKNFAGHQAVIAAHMKEDGNFDVHICINSTRMYEEEKLDFMKKSCDYVAGKKHRCIHERLVYLKQSTMDICRENELYQVDLLSDRSDSYDKISDKEYNQAQRGQKKLDEENAEKIAKGEAVTVTKYDTQKEELRQAIRETASYSTDFEDFKRNLMQDFGIEVTESRGRIGYIHPDRNKPTRADKLGEGYTKEAIEEQLNRQQGEPNRDLEPEERKADFLLKFGNWSVWREDEYPEIIKLQLPENEIRDYVLKNSQELHTAIRGISEDEKMPEYSEQAKQYIQELDGRAGELREKTSAELRQEYVDVLQKSGVSLADKIQAAEEIKKLNIEEGVHKSFEYKALELYGRDTRTVFGKDHKELEALWDKWEQKANTDKMWGDYREVSDKFWQLQNTLMSKKNDERFYAKNAIMDADEAFEYASYMVRTAKDPITAWFYVIVAIYELIQYNRAINEYHEVQREYQALRQNTSDFKRFSQEYKEDLQAGKMPHQDCLDAMTKLAETLDKENEKRLEGKYGKERLQAIRANQIELAKNYSQQQYNSYHRRDWKQQQMDETMSYARKHDLNIDNTPDKIKEFGRELGEARKKAEETAKAVKQMKGTINAIEDCLATHEFEKIYTSITDDKEKERYYEENKEKIDTFYLARDVLEKRGARSAEMIEEYVKSYEEAIIEDQKAQKDVSVKKQNYIEACKFRDNIFKIYQRNGVYLDGFDKSKNRASGRTQTGGTKQTDWRAVAAEVGRADSSRTAQADQRSEGKGIGERSAQKDIDRVQRQVRGVAKDVARSVGGNRAEQQTAKRDDRAEAPSRANDKQQVRTNPHRTHKGGR